MGQYYKVINIDKRQYICPRRFGEGSKLMEIHYGAGRSLGALAVLLSSGNGRGGGDLSSDHPLVGSWAGDRIVIAGDYSDPIDKDSRYNKIPFLKAWQDGNLYDATEHMEDISKEIITVISKAEKDFYYMKEYENPE